MQDKRVIPVRDVGGITFNVNNAQPMHPKAKSKQYFSLYSVQFKTF